MTQAGLVRIGEIHDDGQAGGGYARCHVCAPRGGLGF